MNDPTCLKTDETALMWSIYLSLLSSMSPVAAEACFGIPKTTGLITYRGAVEHTFRRANFFTEPNLIMLQCLVLFLSLGRSTDDANQVWVLTGLANRLCNISKVEISPFEQELRNRLQWKLWYLDHRAHQDLSQSEATLTPRPPLPSNTRDRDISPMMASPA